MQATTADAEPQQAEAVHLSWEAPAECPSSDDVLAETRRLLAHDEALPAGETLTARAVVTHDEAWSVVLETVSRSGRYQRTLHAQTCRGLADATALILALAVNPDAVARTQAASPAAAAPPEHVHVSLALPLSLSAGMLPEPDYAVGAGVVATAGAARVELSIHDWLHTATATAAGSPAGGTFRLVSGTLYGCGAPRFGRFDAGGCALLDAGRFDAAAVDVSRSTPASALWLAAGAGGFAAASLDAGGVWSIPLHLDVLVPLLRPAFVVQNVGPSVYRPPPIAGRASLGVALRFW
jgi:hypothetical protein